MLFTDDKRLNALTQEVDGQSFDGHNFCLSVRRSYRNSFTTVCIGKLIPQATGTVVDVQFGMRPFVKSFCLCSPGIWSPTGAFRQPPSSRRNNGRNQAAKILGWERSFNFSGKRSWPSRKASRRAATNLPRKTLRSTALGKK